MNTIIYSHRNGDCVVPKETVDEIINLLDNLNISLGMYVTAGVRAAISEGLARLGWPDKLFLDRQSHISITSMRDNVGLCIQTGNVSRIYADLLKLQALFLRGTISSSTIILPTVTAAKKMGCNVASFERLKRELHVFSQVITMPLVIIGFYD